MADFETTPLGFGDALAELVGWSGQYVHVEVSIAGGAGVSSFDGRIAEITAGQDEGTVQVAFQANAAVVALDDVMSAAQDSSPTMEVRRLRFTVGEHQSVDFERKVPEEIGPNKEGALPHV
jgi:hypothetical protein